MEPNSGALLGVLLLAAATCLVLLVRMRRVALRVGAGTLALVLAATMGIASVNDYYGYYQSWSQLTADATGSYASFATSAGASSGPGVLHGRLESVTLPGAISGISRTGLVYLPPQYTAKAYAHTRFPVVELLHGTPGNPSSWVVHLDITRIADRMINDHLMGPTVLVMPTMSTGATYQECLNAPGFLDDTYITQDVRRDIEARFRVSTVAAEWGVAGYSSGGYCAANLALRHPADFGAAAMMDGYFRPQDGPAAAALDHNAAAIAANDPLSRARALTTGTAPLPAFWVSAGTGNRLDIEGASAFVRALHGVEEVDLYTEPNAGHNVYAWTPAIPRLLTWMWPHLAPPQLKVDFPIAGPVRNSMIIAPNLPGYLRWGGRHSPAKTSRSVLAHGGAVTHAGPKAAKTSTARS